MKTRITIILVIVFFIEAKAQHFTHDLGVFLSRTSLQTDYGQKGNLASNFNNNGVSFGVAHYLHFFNRTLRWDPNDIFQNHLMVKTELQYINNTKLEHFGKWASQDSFGGEQLRAMKGSVRMFNIGINLEYHLFTLEEFVFPSSDISFNPFVSFGLNYSFFNNSLTSSLGDWEKDLDVLPAKYNTEGALNIGAGEATSLIVGLGTRYKLTERLDFSTQCNFQYFFSDKIDGLQSDVYENKNNDWLVNLQFGFIYHLNFSSPLF